MPAGSTCGPAHRPARDAPRPTAPPCRAPTSTSRRPCRRCSRSARRSAPAASRRSWSSRSGSTASPADSGCPRRPWTAPWPRSTPTSAPAWRSRSARLRLTCEAELSTTPRPSSVPGGTVTERWVPVDRVGLYVPGGSRPWSPSVVMNVVPAQVAGVRVDRAVATPRSRTTAGCRTRRSSPPARCSASTRSTPSAARRRSRCSPTARASARGSTWSPVRATSTWSRPSGSSRVGRHRLRGRPDRDRGPGRRLRRPGVRRGRPDQPGRARPAGGRGAGHRLASRSPTTSRPSSTAGRRHQARRADPHRPGRAAVGHRAGRRLEQGLDVVNAYAAEHLEIQTADAGGRRGAGPQRRRDLRRPVRAGLAGRLLRRLQPRAADRRLRLPLLGALGAVVLRGGPRRRLLRRGARRGGRHVVTLADAEDLPGHGAAVRSGSAG